MSVADRMPDASARQRVKFPRRHKAQSGLVVGDIQLVTRLKKVERQLAQMQTLYKHLLALVDPEDLQALEKLERITPTNAVLLQWCKANPPPQEWFDGDEERPW